MERSVRCGRIKENTFSNKNNDGFIFQARIKPSAFFGRIVNGEDAQSGEIPYQVSLQTWYNFHFCGGAVLTKNYVITAAHCVVDIAFNDIKIIAGSTNLNDPQSTHAVEKIIIHEDYTPDDSWRNDIALIKIKSEFNISSILNYVSLPFLHQKIPAGSIAIVSGWGRLWQNGPSMSILQKAQVFIASQEYCENINAKEGLTVHSSHICAIAHTTETGSCHGDSGGPLTVDGKLVGLVSWGVECGSTKYPTVYTRVSEYLNWIDENVV
ncbi:hypothetical protein PV327_003523 [Microctonus hyperodae]|uniref:chymotrypsin n=1 Tax=Microctonus hyperodae TaxID=165561 RepID=A0AA39G4N3_MICHY|nr:hypothetical protein PV327_003523 [Microctonus hyperodae]